MPSSHPSTVAPSPAGLASAPPTRVRYGVIAFAIGLAMVTYLDRACIAALAPDIMRDLSLSKEQMSWVFSSFALAYMIFEVPTAWWADRQGTRRVLTRIVLWWSAFTMATAAAFNLAAMVIIRFLFGIGEAGAWPCVARTFSRWVPVAQRGRVQGIFFSGAHLAGGVTPFIAIWLGGLLGWRSVFLVFGVLGIGWAIAWHRWFRDDPAEHPGVNAAERELILAGRGELPAGHDSGGGYWMRLLKHHNTLPLCIAYIPNSALFYFCISWLPTYLKEKHGFDPGFSGVPLIAAVIGDLSGGAITDWVTRRFGLRWGRAGVSGFFNVIAGVALLAATQTTNPILALTLISVAVVATMTTLGATWGTCIDIGGRHVGVVSAAMNTAGQLGSFFGPPVVIALLTRFGDWNAPILAIGFLFLACAACWCLINPREKIFE